MTYSSDVDMTLIGFAVIPTFLYPFLYPNAPVSVSASLGFAFGSCCALLYYGLVWANGEPQSVFPRAPLRHISPENVIEQAGALGVVCAAVPGKKDVYSCENEAGEYNNDMGADEIAHTARRYNVKVTFSNNM
jgi:hypothetical protein